jgi:hypothetical protein
MRERSSYPGGKHRKSLEPGSNIPFWKIFGFFSMLYGQFLLDRTGNWSDGIEKKSENFSKWNTASMLQRFLVFFRRNPPVLLHLDVY